MKKILFLGMLCGAVACGDGPHPGFKEAADGIWFKLHVLGEGQQKPMTGDSVLLRMRIALPGRPAGSLYSTERYFVVDRARTFDMAMLDRMNEGDSVTVLVERQRFPWAQWIGPAVPAPEDTSLLHVEIGLLAIMDALERDSLLRAARFAAGNDSTEQKHLAAFIDSADWTRWGTSLLFYRITDQGKDTIAIASGRTVTVKLTGAFLDGRVFDRGASVQPMTFVLGDPGQVINGVEVAVHLLHNGGAGEFVIPSAMAYGPEGSSSGIVPPWTPVRYSVEVLEVAPLPTEPH